jgi:hypothetical protein
MSEVVSLREPDFEFVYESGKLKLIDYWMSVHLFPQNRIQPPPQTKRSKTGGWRLNIRLHESHKLSEKLARDCRKRFGRRRSVPVYGEVRYDDRNDINSVVEVIWWSD